MDAERLQELNEMKAYYRKFKTEYSRQTDALIDAEIQRQSTTDKDIQAAIDLLCHDKIINQQQSDYYSKHLEGRILSAGYKRNVDSYDLVVAALQSYQKPVDADVLAVIDECNAALNKIMLESHGVGSKFHFSTDAIKTLLAALRSYIPNVASTSGTNSSTRGTWTSVKDRLPDNEEHVLLLCKTGQSKYRYICNGFHARLKSVETDHEFGEYDDETDEYYMPEGFYEVIHNWDEYSSVTIEDVVIGWMPLPEPPKEGET